MSSFQTAAPRTGDAPAGPTRPGPSGLRVLVIDDDSGFVGALSNRMSSTGWRYRIHSVAPRSEELASMRLNAIVLDPRVLVDDASDFLSRMSGALPGLGIVVCSPPTTLAQRVRGLRLGADDWVTKPCHPEEVIARVEAVVRRRKRSEAAPETGPLVVGEIEIRADRFQAYVAGASLELTRREFELLQALAGANGRVLRREDVYQRVWGYAMAHGDRSVDVFVRKLRQKLEAASPTWVYIHTHFGVGYRLEPEPVGAGPAEAV